MLRDFIELDLRVGLVIIGCGGNHCSAVWPFMTPVSTPVMMATILQFCNRGRSHSCPELSKIRDKQNQPEDNGIETPKHMRSPQKEISSKRLRVTMESIVSKEEAEKAGKALSEAPVWAKMLLEQMTSVNEEVLDMRKEIEMNQRVGQVENDVKLQQFQCQTMSLEVTSLRKELPEINDTRNDLKKSRRSQRSY